MQVNFSLPRLVQDAIRLERKASMIISFEISRHELASLLSSDRSQKVFLLEGKVESDVTKPPTFGRAHILILFFSVSRYPIDSLLEQKIVCCLPLFCFSAVRKNPAKPSTKAGNKAQRPPSGAELE